MRMAHRHRVVGSTLALCSFLAVAGGTSVASAATITASSPSFAHVSAAVSSAVAGDTVVVPMGTATWSSTLSISKGITLKGAGIDKTVITSGIGDKFTAMLYFNPANSSSRFRLTGFTFNGNWSSTCLMLGAGVSGQNGTRVDSNKFTSCSQYAIRWAGENYGLADHNQFVDNYLGVQILGSDWNSWENYPLLPGTSSSPYFEDNTFTYTGARTSLAFILESGQGGRYVFRHNKVEVLSSAVSGSTLEIFDAHGNQDPVTSAYRPNGNRGTLGIEVYDNVINVRASHRLLNLRGGEAKVFNNVITQAGGSGTYIGMTEYDGWSYHFLSTYPGYDPVKNAFFWNNKVNGSELTPILYSPSEDSFFIKENRDWWRPAFGTAAGRPSTCTTGAYYSSTDTETLFKCQATNSWTTVYAPYQYPHPLAVGGSVPTAPAAPTGVRIVR